MCDNAVWKLPSRVAPQASRYRLNMSVQTLSRLLGSDCEVAAGFSRATEATLSLSLYQLLCECIDLFLYTVLVCVHLLYSIYYVHIFINALPFSVLSLEALGDCDRLFAV